MIDSIQLKSCRETLIHVWKQQNLIKGCSRHILNDFQLVVHKVFCIICRLKTLNENNPCKEPADRARHNEPDGATPKEPDCRDLGYLVRDLAKSIQSLSMEMARLSGLTENFII